MQVNNSAFLNSSKIESPEKREDLQNSSSNICSRIVGKAFDWTKRLSMGAAASVIITPAASAIPYAAQVLGYVPEIKEGQVIKTMIRFLEEAQLVQAINLDSIVNATCPLGEYVKLYNSSINSKIDAAQIKIMTGSLIVANAAIVEELLFRGLLQDLLLTKLPRMIIKKVAPGKEGVIDSTRAKAARILLTSAAFCAIHLSNKGVLSEDYLKLQLIAAFVSGIGLGILKETRAGLLGSIAAHAVNNTLSIMPVLRSC